LTTRFTEWQSNEMTSTITTKLSTTATVQAKKYIQEHSSLIQLPATKFV